jgi:hypothetical protein
MAFTMCCVKCLKWTKWHSSDVVLCRMSDVDNNVSLMFSGVLCLKWVIWYSCVFDILRSWRCWVEVLILCSAECFTATVATHHLNVKYKINLFNVKELVLLSMNVVRNSVQNCRIIAPRTNGQLSHCEILRVRSSMRNLSAVLWSYRMRNW